MKVFLIFIFFISGLMTLYAQNIIYPKIDSAQQKRIDKSIQNGIPLFFLSAEIWYDAAGTPELQIITKNISEKDVDAYTIQVYCYNNFNEPVNHYLKGTNVFTGISQDKLEAGKTVYLNDEWKLYGYDNTTKVKVYLKKVHFVDGKAWIPKDKKNTLIEGKSVY